MKPKKLLIAIALVATLPASAGTWSLDSCIAYAAEHNISVRSSMIDNLGNEQGVIEAKDKFLPTLNAGAAQNWDFGRSLTSENTYANRNTSTFGWQAQLSLPLFQGLSAIRSLRQAQEARRAGYEQTVAVRDQTALAVISYYLQALYNRELLNVSREQLRLSQTQLERQESLLEAGKVPEVDVIQARAQVAQNEVDTVSAANTLRLSLVDLATYLELADTDNFDIEPLSAADEAVLGMPLPPSAELLEHALGSYSSIRAAKAREAVADKSIDVARSGYLPRLSFNAGLQDSYYNMSGMHNSSFSQQMRDNFAKSLGFSLSVPIFDAFSTRNAVRRAKLQKLSASLEVDRQQTELRKAILQAYTQADGAAKKYAASHTAVDAAKAALDAMTEKYTYGKANATEWEQTRSNYITTLSQQVQAKYETILRHRILDFYYTH